MLDCSHFEGGDLVMEVIFDTDASHMLVEVSESTANDSLSVTLEVVLLEKFDAVSKRHHQGVDIVVSHALVFHLTLIVLADNVAS